MTDSERLDLPSASGAYARKHCSGKENLVRELRERNLLRPVEQNADAQSGTRVHLAWATNQEEKLSSSERLTLIALQGLEQTVLEDWSAGCAPDDIVLLGREQRLWLHDGLRPLLSGQFDVAYQIERRVLILDAKTLYGELDPASHNDQLRELVALFRFNYPATEHYTVALLAPNQAERVSIATYDQLEAELALRLLRLSLIDSADPYAPRTPGRWCHYCPALPNCEEAQGLIPHLNDDLGARIASGGFRLPLGERGSLLLEQIKSAKAIIKNLEEAYKAELGANPDALPGWHLRNGKKIRQIAEVQRALDAWQAVRLDIADFLESTDISVSRLQERYGVAAQIKGKRLEQEFNERFSDLITWRQHAPELERDKAPRTL